MKSIFILLMMFPLLVSAQRDWSRMQVTTTEVGAGVFRLFVEPGVATVLFAGAEGALLIDAAYSQTTTQLKVAIEGITPMPLRYLVNTHHHADHTGGNAVFGEDATVIAHRFVKDFISTNQVQGTRQIAALPRAAWPEITFNDKLQLYLNGQTIELIHIPGGHTAGDIIVYFPESKVLVLGDLLFADNFPFVDIANGGNPMRFIEHLRWISQNFPEGIALVGGHGPVYTMEQLRSYIKNLEKTMEVVRNAKMNGMTLEQAKANRILQEWEAWGRFFITEDRWIETLYQAL